VIALLHRHHAQQLQDRLLAGEQWQDHDLVFCSRIGTPIVPRNFLRERQALLRRAGIPNIRFHDLRHSFVSLLIAAGVPLKVVQELAGHSDPRITQQIYTHVTDDQKREAASIMDTLLSGALQNVG
jgi:integrase